MARSRASPRTTWDRDLIRDVKNYGIVAMRGLHHDYSTPWHSHIGVELLICLDGEGLFYVGDEVIPYAAGSLIIFDSQLPHRVHMRQRYDRYNICFWPAGLTDQYDPQRTTRYGSPNLNVVGPTLRNVYYVRYPTDDFPGLQRLFVSLAEEATIRRTGYREMVRMHLAALFLWFDRLQNEANTPVKEIPVPPPKHPIADIVAFIERNLGTDLSVQSVSRRFHLSTSNLYRIMQQAFDQSPSQYIMSRRLAVAKQLLVRSELTVAEIAAIVGVSSGPNLSRLFRKAENETPTEYRNRHLS